MYSYKTKRCYTKINLGKSNRSVSRGAERILNVQHPRTYKDIVTNAPNSSSIIHYKF
ncbi:MAG: palindromic element RPE5 domain-containing protein [Rickettsia africae]|nr:palindromic element RPE5 domain-containing protein [Rickettsia africae]